MSLCHTAQYVIVSHCSVFTLGKCVNQHRSGVNKCTCSYLMFHVMCKAYQAYFWYRLHSYTSYLPPIFGIPIILEMLSQLLFILLASLCSADVGSWRMVCSLTISISFSVFSSDTLLLVVIVFLSFPAKDMKNTLPDKSSDVIFRIPHTIFLGFKHESLHGAIQIVV